MGEFSPTAAQLATASAAASADAKRTGLSFKEYQDLKTGVHRDLISRVDLERISTQRDERIRAQVLSVIQDLVANLKTPLSGRERERLSLEVLAKCSDWVLLSPFYRIQPSTTFSSMDRNRSMWSALEFLKKAT